MTPNTAVFFASVLTMAAFACGGESNDGDDGRAGRDGATPGAGHGGAPQGGEGGRAGASGTSAGASGTSAGASGTTPGASGTTVGAGGAAGSATTGGAGGGTSSAGANNAGEGGSTPELVVCDPRLIVCKRVAPSCAQGEVPSVDGNCYGPCVPIEHCGCDEPADCPDDATYTCWNFAAHCGFYVR